MKKKIAVITGGSYLAQKGFFNAMLNRVKHLRQLGEFDVSVYQCLKYDTWIVRKLRHTQKVARISKVEVDGVVLNLIWRPQSLLDYILEVKLGCKPVLETIFMSKTYKRLKSFDFIEAHTLECGLVALKAKKEYGIPFGITWHGSDIHTDPYMSNYKKRKTIEIIDKADVNFFVSRALLESSNQLTGKGNKIVLYNGSDERFVRFDDDKRSLLRKNFGVENTKVIAFVGNFREVKNVLQIPNIYRKVAVLMPNVSFWMIGDGKLRKQVEQLSKGLNVIFWGNQDVEKMPDFMNCVDVLILPSINEGLPLTLVEALASGARCVGSKVGGIPEVIGEENTFDLHSPSFVDDFAKRVVEICSGFDSKQSLSPVFNWNNTAIEESKAIRRIIG